MCRVAAIIGQEQSELENLVLRMTTSMQHGGPDDSGVYIDKDLSVALGHRRLSIIDLSGAGHQPMPDLSGKYIISFNGEIYNYIEIRNELKKKGYILKSNSDTEVLVYGYKEWGAALLPRLKGMFAFIILDKEKKQVFAARDHSGIKPLYYGKNNGSFYFSSEVRGILGADPSWQQDEDWLARFLAFGSIPEPFSTLKNVFHLPKGSYLLYNIANASYDIHRYIDFPFSSSVTSLEEAVSKTRSAVLEAVERHLVADVPVGIFLSGGIDSSILTFACRKFNKGQIKTLSIYFNDEKYSEKYYQDLVVEKTGVCHQSFLVSQEDFEKSLPDFFKAMDQPSVDGINSYFITRYAKQYGLKVVLSGLGADELFGGYSTFHNPMYYRLKKMRLAVKVASAFLPKYPGKKLRFINKGNPLEEYLFNRGLFVPSDIAFITGLTEKKVWTIIENRESNNWSDYDHGNRISMLEQNIYMQNQLLRDSDIYSMWHGLELRVPFLDIDIIRLAHSIAPAIKFNQKRKKQLLIKAFIEDLPEQVWNRQKMGFAFPFENWFKNSVYLANAEDGNFRLKQARDSFNSGKLNWSRYWSQLVASDFFKKNFTRSTFYQTSQKDSSVF